MEKLVKLIEKVGSINVETMLKDAFHTIAVAKEVKRINQEQLYSGIDARGIKLKTIRAQEQGQIAYAKRTIQRKKKYGEPYNRVTLKDTGAFYSSIKVKSLPGHALITGESDKGESTIESNFFPVYTKALLGIYKEYIPELNQTVIPKLRNDLRTQLK